MKHLSKPGRRTTLSLVIAAVLVAVGAAIFVKHGQTEATTPPARTAAPITTVQSQFSFAGAAGWRQGPSNKTSMALFSNDTTCFTSMEYKAGTVDVAARLQEQQAEVTRGGGTVTPGATVSATLQTNTGQQSYELHQYTLTGGSEQVMAGLQLGYVQLPGGYIQAQGHCNTTDQLPSSVAALQAYRFTKAN